MKLTELTTPTLLLERDKLMAQADVEMAEKQSRSTRDQLRGLIAGLKREVRGIARRAAVRIVRPT